MLTQTLPEIITESAGFIWTSLVVFIPRLFLAILLFVLFLIIAAAFEKVISRLLHLLKVDTILKKIGVEQWIEKVGFHLDSGAFIGVLVKWFFIITGLLVASNLLGLAEVSVFLTQILLFIPNVVVAAFILIAGAVLAEVLGKAVESSISAGGFSSGPFVHKVVRWSVMIFAFIGALEQLGVAQTFINTLYIGIVGMLALAGGLAFGLGGKDHASDFIGKIKEDICK